MSKVVLVCYRDRSRQLDASVFNRLSRCLVPDNIDPNPPRILTAPGLNIGIINPNSAVLSQNTSVSLGYLFGTGGEWWCPLAAYPDGSYALFRSDDHHVELVSDACASRTVWYVLTDEMFVASTSQRAIVAVLGSYQPNRQSHAWMLSAGNIGPGLSWDRRIKCVDVNSRVVLDRSTWTIREIRDAIEFASIKSPDYVHRERFIEALHDVFGSMRLDYATWHLMLSGGLDSRCILLMLEDKAGLHSITWGLASALGNPDSDAVVARKLADHFGVSHEYFATDIAVESIGTVFERLLVAGEARTDTMSAYMDGCRIWARLFNANITGVIRGDVVFSPYHVYSEADVRRIDGAMFMSDFGNLARYSQVFGENQYWPESFHRRMGETLSTWRDRLTYQYRAPVIWAALNEIKSAYVEVMNPLLSRRILQVIASLPDHLRDGRSLYRKIISDLSPPIEFAGQNAIQHSASILSNASVSQYLRASLNSARARDLLPGELVDYILGSMPTRPAHPRVPGRLPKFFKRLIPQRLRMAKQRLTQPRDMDVSLLAIRAHIIVEMDRRLAEDSRVLAP